MTFHLDAHAVQRYEEDMVDRVSAVSIEAHLTSCGQCRDLLSRGDEWAIRSWLAVADRVEPQRLNLVGRGLVATGVSRDDAFLVSSAPNLSTAWVVAVLFALCFALLAAGNANTSGTNLFLLIAPMVPLIGVGMAFNRDLEPLFELTVAAPYSKLRLFLTRSATVLAITIPLTVAGALAVGADWWTAGIWLVPALAFSIVILALAPWVETQVSTGAIAVGWFLANVAFVESGRTMVTFSTAAILVYIVVGLAAGLVIAVRARNTLLGWNSP